MTEADQPSGGRSTRSIGSAKRFDGVLRALLRFSRPYPWALPGLVVLGLLASFAEGLGIGLLIPLLDQLVGGGGTVPSGPFAHWMQQAVLSIADEARVAMLGSLMIVLIVLKSLILFADVGLATWVNGRITHDLRLALYRRMLAMDYGEFARSDQGQLVSGIESQTHRTSDALTVLATLIGAACTVVVFTLLLLLICWPLTITVMLGVLLVSLVMRRMTQRANRHGETFVDTYGVLAGRIVEGLAQMRTVRLFGQERREEEPAGARLAIAPIAGDRWPIASIRPSFLVSIWISSPGRSRW
jgi:subfamily B ATP-binding cassette protein MsbA